MISTKKIFRSLLFMGMILGFAQPGFSQNPNIDVKSYQFNLKLNDQNDTIRGDAIIKFVNLTSTDQLSFDLVKKKTSGKGMTVDSVFSKGEPLHFTQYAQTLSIDHQHPITQVTIYYHGIPDDGLIIGKNQFGNRTFFGDNWPNRAHNWLPCIDHPSDKALVEFRVNAPDHYQVVSNGKLVYRKKISPTRVVYDYQSNRPLPTKVMVIGVTHFAIDREGTVAGVPLSSWVYPENKKAGFRDYAQAKPILKFYVENIGPFPFAKLANVQSTTRFGGMENAGAIFYAEKSVTGHQKAELLLAHEMAHQWFGDSISETDWPQLWLSEGFATYFADLYAKHTHGEKFFRERLARERQQAIAFSKHRNAPVIDTTETHLMRLLDANSYQKGAWVLQMLRTKVGDKVFWKAIRSYYQKYKFQNANSRDLEHVFENISGLSLKHFFDEWLRQPGQPVLTITWDDAKNLTVKQPQAHPFTFPLELLFTFDDGSSQIETYQIDKQNEHIDISNMASKAIKTIELDPRVKLLFEQSPGQANILTRNKS